MAILTVFALLLSLPSAAFEKDFGFIYDTFGLTLEPGRRTEVAGPLFHREESDSGVTWAFSPLLSKRTDDTPDMTEWELLYPILTYDRFGQEFRVQLFQLLSWSGGARMQGGEKKRLTIFPFYFQQRSKAHPEENYTALLPIYGRLKNRFFRDEVQFVMLPLYVKSKKRDVTTWNYVYPIFHLRKGTALKGLQAWPLVGNEVKEPSQRTNNWGDIEVVGGHKRSFVLWPFYLKAHNGIGTTNEARQLAVIPFYTQQRSPLRDSTSYGFPLGYTKTVDREKKYTEWDMPWPFVVVARGEGKHANRVWPLFSNVKTPTGQSAFYLWPIYKMNRVTAPPLDRKRTRILLFGYSDLIERDTVRNTAFRRRDLWPLYTHRMERNGNSRLQILAPLEPILPNNKSIERLYSPIWSVWRAEKNPQTGAGSQSLLWNLYRREKTAEARKLSLLFGLIHYEKGASGAHWRLLYIPMGKRAQPPEELN